MSAVPVVVGVDIGGTNTDVVVVCQKDGKPQVLSEIKELTTRDVTTGVKKAVLRALLQAKDKGHLITPIQVNIGTTHFVNAVVQGKDLAKVAVIRICGPVSEELPPFCDFPSRLAKIVSGSVHLIEGGTRYDGKEHQPLNEKQLKDILTKESVNGIQNVAYVGIFSPTRPDQENRARELTNQWFPKMTVSVSHEIGIIGILERENATILNECLKPLCKKTVGGFKAALEDIGLTCPFYFTQNDGTIISSDGVLEQPVQTFASGPTNSMRGATFLSELKDAIVVDIGGTTTDVGMLKNGFPREASTQVRVGGVKTNFRMPDVVSIGLGGGSYVRDVGTGKGGNKTISVGPRSAGLNLLNEALVFGNGTDEDMKQRSITTTDIAVAKGLYLLGSKERVTHLSSSLVDAAVDEVHRMVEELVDKIKLSKEELPVIVVGGGSILIDLKRNLRGASKVIVPEYFGVANAIGAALSKVSASFNNIVNLLDMVDVEEMKKKVEEAVKSVTNDPDGKEFDLATNEAQKPFFLAAKEKAMEDIFQKIKSTVVSLGGDENSVEVLDKQDSTLSYLPGHATQIKVKVVADLGKWNVKNQSEWNSPADYKHILKDVSTVPISKQTFSSTGVKLTQEADDEEEIDFTQFPKEPKVDPVTGEWILSEWDIECIVVGAGIYGCGGGASPNMGRLRAQKALKDGKKMRVVTPERLFRNANKDVKNMVIVSAFLGAPLIMYEQGVSSSETTKALECLKETYEIGRYKDGDLENKEGIEIDTSKGGCKFVHNYKPNKSYNVKEEYKIIGLMSAEIGGMNAIEPFLIAANLDLPIVDADGMSRAFPEVQMFIPYMLGNPPYPVSIVGSGNYTERSTLLYSPGNKLMENFLRDVSIRNGCSSGMAIPLSESDVKNKTAMYTVSSAWRLGNAVLRARIQKESVIQAIIDIEDARHVISGKIKNVQRETSGGFNRGFVLIEGVESWQNQEMLIEFQNENLVLIPLGQSGEKLPCVGCVPDLISIVDADTAEPVPTEEVRYGMRVTVLLMPSHELLRKEESLKWVGPSAFHYEDIAFKPYKKRSITKPVPLL